MPYKMQFISYTLKIHSNIRTVSAGIKATIQEFRGIYKLEYTK